jgi:cytochrome c oxidase subunit 2
MSLQLWLDQASEGARDVDHLLLWLLATTAFFIAVTAGPILIFSYWYRRENRVNRRIDYSGVWKLEAAWALIPLVIAMLLFAYSAAFYFRQRHPPETAREIHVIGKQWMWKLQHPEGKREINSLHLPVGVPVKLLMTSQDVIHSFFIPSFRLKQDVLPGQYTTLWFTATKPGRYRLFCAEYCGTDHSRMTGWVTVMPAPDYQRWLATGEPQEGPALAGARLFRNLGCSGCHVNSAVARPVVHAPDLTGLFGSPVPLEGGKIIIADERYLRDSILLPNSEITQGYQPIMPTYQGKISEGDIMALIAYLKSLSQSPLQGSATSTEAPSP